MTATKNWTRLPSPMIQKLSRNLLRSSFLSLLALLRRLPSVRLALVLPQVARGRRLSRFGSIRSATSSCDSHAPSTAGLPSRSSPTRSIGFWMRCRTSIRWPERPKQRGNSMSRHNRFGPALSLVAIASIMTGCAAPSSHVSSASGFGGKTNGEVGLATRALAELNANNIPAAIDFAERAVQKTPDDAGFRALLGSAYFAGGRFKSAEQAYKDSLSIYSNQPQVILKLALVDIALGKNSEALGFLEAGRDVLDPSDYGLAVALAGRPADAIPLLEAAARGPNSDARVRQNLALAYALNGDWTNARTVAAQDVPGDQLDARIHQWMQMAAPGHESIAVAALVGVTPAAVDPGQPTRLALRKTDTQMAQAPAPAPVAAPSPAFQSSPVQF